MWKHSSMNMLLISFLSCGFDSRNLVNLIHASTLAENRMFETRKVHELSGRQTFVQTNVQVPSCCHDQIYRLGFIMIYNYAYKYKIQIQNTAFVIVNELLISKVEKLEIQPQSTSLKISHHGLSFKTLLLGDCLQELENQRALAKPL